LANGFALTALWEKGTNFSFREEGFGEAIMAVMKGEVVLYVQTPLGDSGEGRAGRKGAEYCNGGFAKVAMVGKCRLDSVEDGVEI
jgi:hypothetical protein